MLRYLADPANLITAGGLLCSSAALFFTMSGRVTLAIAAALWAVLADHLDGVVAKRTANRSAELSRMGKSLDGFADLVYGAVIPALVIIQISHASSLSFLTAAALVLAGALRLSYFNNFGMSSDGRFLGVPLSYDVPLLALFLLTRPWLPAEGFTSIVNAAFLALAALHVASIRVPGMNRAMYIAVTIFAVAASGILAMQELT